MLNKEKYPILEFDSEKEALINPYMLEKKYGKLSGNRLVITFFRDAVKLLTEEGKLEEHLTISGENDLVLYKFTDSDTYLMPGIIGCPACGGYLDELTGLGIEKVMFCGGGGVLDKNIGVGELLIVEGAIRDEGFSYHYAPPSRVIETQADVRETMRGYLDKNGLPYIEGLVWTTDAFYRETKEKIALRRSEGAKIVEMEQAGCIAVSAFRGIKYGAVIYGGDDVSGDTWDKRGWNKKKGIRYALVNICREIVELL